MLVRIQLSRKKGWRMPANTVKCDRTTKRGNPFFCHRKGGPGAHCRRVTPDATYCCLDTYEEWVRSGFEGRPSETGSVMAALDAVEGYPARTAHIEAIKAARGFNLACWCKAADDCHCDIQLELANTPQVTA
jgi:hypothetical protein